MKTSEYLKKVQLHFMQPDRFDCHKYFLCLVAGHIAGLDVKRMHEILRNHGLYSDGSWNSELSKITYSMDYPSAKNLRIFVRGLFLDLAIQHYESKGD